MNEIVPLEWSELFQFSSVQSLSRVRLFATSWTAVHQASLSFTISQSLLKLVSTESVMPSNHLILCCPLLLLPSIFPSIRVLSNESALRIWWPKNWSVGWPNHHFFLQLSSICNLIYSHGCHSDAEGDWGSKQVSR